MPKRKVYKRLGIRWRSIKVGVPVAYPGTVDGVKNAVCRANKIHEPRKFTWHHKDKSFVVERIE